MEARMKHPVAVIPEAMTAIRALSDSFSHVGVPDSTLSLIHQRISQINSCSACLVGGDRMARKAGESNDRLAAVAGWRDAPYYTDAERAALALAECVTRLSDRPDPVPDGVWNAATAHFDEKGMAALLLAIATTNVYNRLNASTRQVAGAWG